MRSGGVGGSDVSESIKAAVSCRPVVAAVPSNAEAGIALLPGRHGKLLQACVRDLFGNFVPDAQVLCLADAAKGSGPDVAGLLVLEGKQLHELGVPSRAPGQKLADIIAYSGSRR